MSTYAIGIKKFCDKTKANVDQVNRAVVLDLLTRVVNKSPVKTGWFRGNWQVGGNNQLKVGILDRKDPTGSEAISDGAGVAAGIKSGGVVWISNNLPYARRLEYGWSQQAPQGMVRLSINEVQSQFDRIVSEVANGR